MLQSPISLDCCPRAMKFYAALVLGRSTIYPIAPWPNSDALFRGSWRGHFGELAHAPCHPHSYSTNLPCCAQSHHLCDSLLLSSALYTAREGSGRWPCLGPPKDIHMTQIGLCPQPATDRGGTLQTIVLATFLLGTAGESERRDLGLLSRGPEGGFCHTTWGN